MASSPAPSSAGLRPAPEPVSASVDAPPQEVSAPETPLSGSDSKQAERETSRRSVSIWVLLLACLALGAVIFVQHRLANGLEARIAGLEETVREKNALLSAHRGHLGEIRGSVEQLVNQLGGLQSLVASDPEEGVLSATAAGPPDGSASDPSLPAN